MPAHRALQRFGSNIPRRSGNEIFQKFPAKHYICEKIELRGKIFCVNKSKTFAFFPSPHLYYGV